MVKESDSKVFNSKKFSIWISMSIFIPLVFLGAYYLIGEVRPAYYSDRFDYLTWFLVVFSGCYFSGLAIYLFNDLTKGALFKKKQVKITPSIPAVFVHSNVYPSNPLVDNPNLFSGGNFFCKYDEKKYCIVGSLLYDFSSPHLHIENDDERILVNAKNCHLIARSPNDLTDEEEMELRNESIDILLYFLLKGIYPFGDEDFKKGVVLNIRNFQ